MWSKDIMLLGTDVPSSLMARQTWKKHSASKHSTLFRPLTISRFFATDLPIVVDLISTLRADARIVYSFLHASARFFLATWIVSRLLSTLIRALHLVLRLYPQHIQYMIFTILCARSKPRNTCPHSCTQAYRRRKISENTPNTSEIFDL